MKDAQFCIYFEDEADCFLGGLNENGNEKRESNMTFMIFPCPIRRPDLPFTDLRKSVGGVGLERRIRSCA